MTNQKLSKFLSKLNEIRGPYVPSFKIGDVIMNKMGSLKIVSEVINIDIYKGPELKILKSMGDKSIGHYVLLDMVNDHKKKPENIKYTRQRDIHKIDATYELMNPDVARILYKRNTGETR